MLPRAADYEAHSRRLTKVLEHGKQLYPSVFTHRFCSKMARQGENHFKQLAIAFHTMSWGELEACHVEVRIGTD